jgi:hypothetical protein
MLAEKIQRAQESLDISRRIVELFLSMIFKVRI